jgi:hypothetical protein
VFCFNFSDSPYSLLGLFRGLQKGTSSAIRDLLRRAEWREDTKCTVCIMSTSASRTLLKWSYRLSHRGITLLIAVYSCAYTVLLVLLHRTLLSTVLWPIGLCRIFRNRLINVTIFGNRRINTKRVLIFCTNFIRNSFISGRIECDITVNVHKSSCKMQGIFYWILTKLEFFGHILMKVSCVKFHD